MKKKIVILGAGESGAGSAVLALKHGFDVFVSDLGEIKEKYRNVLDGNNVKWEQGIHTEINRKKKMTMYDCQKRGPPKDIIMCKSEAQVLSRTCAE